MLPSKFLIKVATVMIILIMALSSIQPVLASPTNDDSEEERGIPSPAFDIQTTVSVSNLNLVCAPPSPVTQGIRLTGDFVIQAHIVLPPNPILPPSPVIPVGTIVTLHLDATRISGVGLTDGALYQGSQGTSQNFMDAPSTMIFEAAFEFVPQNPTGLPPSPICPAQLTFQVQIYETEPGFPTISASLNILE